ncbi:hypothetical protein [Peribacillus sp. SCS-37]|uniref:hypothetical protein n=1 Tax=Paraperibacillus esterisolvens TaxID=3115296 RepID=UPI003905AE92
MILEDLAVKINKSVEDLELATARLFMEENIDILTDHKNMLNKNARELLNFLVEQRESGYKPLTRKDFAIINAINTYASKFDLQGLKIIIRENTNLLLGKEVTAHLNSDAKIILEGMAAINKINKM